MSHTKIRVSVALAAIAVGAGIVACDVNTYDNCPDWQCGDGLFLAPYIIAPVGIYGQPGYHPQVIIQPGSPSYHTTYVGKPPNFTPPPSAKVNPPGAKPPANYKPPSGSTLTVQKAPKQSGNQMPGGSTGKSGGGNQTVQKAPSGSSGGGSRSSGGSSGGSGRSGK